MQQTLGIGFLRSGFPQSSPASLREDRAWVFSKEPAGQKVHQNLPLKGHVLQKQHKPAPTALRIWSTPAKIVEGPTDVVSQLSDDICVWPWSLLSNQTGRRKAHTDQFGADMARLTESLLDQI